MVVAKKVGNLVTFVGTLERKQSHHQKVALAPGDDCAEEIPPFFWTQSDSQLVIVTLIYPKGWVAKKQSISPLDDNAAQIFCAVKRYDEEQKIVVYLCGDAQIRLSFKGSNAEQPAYLIKQRRNNVTLTVD